MERASYWNVEVFIGFSIPYSGAHDEKKKNVGKLMFRSISDISK